MDYEKAYKESFGVAQCLHEAGDTTTKKQMERLFPQLVESDDEWNWRKVRRAIRGFFTNPIDANELLAWLEKQKECVINSNKTSTDEDERIRKALIDALKVSETIGELKFRLPYPTREECIAYLEKQKEQPISAEEVLARAGLKPYKDGNQWCILAGDNIQEGVCGFGDTIEDALYEFLKEVLDFQKEQKPVVTHGETYRVNTLGTQQVIAGKMPQKPAEWSEEDENMAYFVNQFLEYHELSDPTAKSCKKWFNNRFKSLRPQGSKDSLQPHWKPSEEQMKALLGAEGISRASGYPDNAKVLASLYEQIKKLM